MWPDTFVEEANLSVNVSALRKVLGTGEDGHAYIQTIPRRGYRFVAPPAADAARRARATAEHRRAPVRATSPPGAGDEYLGVGTSVALISRLSRLSGIVVRPTSAILKYGGRRPPTRATPAAICAWTRWSKGRSSGAATGCG